MLTQHKRVLYREGALIDDSTRLVSRVVHVQLANHIGGPRAHGSSEETPMSIAGPVVKASERSVSFGDWLGKILNVPIGLEQRETLGGGARKLSYLSGRLLERDSRLTPVLSRRKARHVMGTLY
jgi:hypothetical protein